MPKATLTLREFVVLDSAGKIRETPLVQCQKCQIELQETITGNRAVGDARVCSDCYFKDFGDLVDERPIGVPHSRR